MVEKREYLVEIGILNRKRKRDENTQLTRKKQRAEKTTAGFIISFDYETVFIWDGTIKPYWLHYKVSTYSNEMFTEGFIVAETKQEIEDNVVTRKFIDFLDKFEAETKQIVPCFRKFQFIACGNSQEDIPVEFKYKQLLNCSTGQYGYFKTELIDEPCETSQQINTFVSTREFKFFPLEYEERYFDILLKDSKKAYIHDGQKGFLKQYTPQMSRQYD
jgi:hypothetical protein